MAVNKKEEDHNSVIFFSDGSVTTDSSDVVARTLITPTWATTPTELYKDTNFIIQRPVGVFKGILAEHIHTKGINYGKQCIC